MRRVAAGLALALAVFLASCDTLLVDPAPAGPEVRLSLSGPLAVAGDFGDLTGGLLAVRDAAFTLVHQGQSRDTVVAASVENDTVKVRLALRPEESLGWLEIHVVLRTVGRQPLFRGVTLVQAFTVAPGVDLVLTPVATDITGWLGQTMSALGDTVELSGYVRFANNVAIPGAEIVWSSSNPAVAEVVAGNRLVSRGNGNAVVSASSLEATSSRDFTVRQLPTILTGLGPADTTVALGASFQARPFGEDGNGYPLLPGAAVQWNAGGAVDVTPNGVVIATSVGTGFVEVTRVGGSTHTATVTVTP